MEFTAIVLIVLAFIAAFLGILGAIVPIIPGALVSYLAVILYYFGSNNEITLTALIVWAAIVIIVSIIDIVIPPIITRAMGGSKSAGTGSFIGVLVGSFFIPPFGMILGAFIGALIGEHIHSKELKAKEFRAALGSFLGFILGTGLKLIVSIMILIYLIHKLI